MNPRFLAISMLAATGISLSTAVAADDTTTTANSAFIRKLVNEALTNHPKMDAAEARTQAAEAAVRTVRLWEDPQLMLGGTAARKSMRMDDGDIMVGAEQMLPRRGLFQAEKRRATAEQAMQGAEQRMTASDLGLSVAQSALELALADDLLRLQAAELRELNALVDVARERAKNPDATAVETLRLEGELELRTQTLEAAKRQRTRLGLTLSLLTGRSPRAEWPELSLPNTVSAEPSSSALLARLEKDNPSLAVLRHKIEAAQAETDASVQKRKPAFMVGVESNIYSGGDLRDVMFTLKMSLPWFNDPIYKAETARTNLLRDAAQHDLASEVRTLDGELASMLTEAENQRRLAKAYRTQVLPRQEKTVEAVKNAWVSSKATLLEVLEARRMQLDTRMEMERALAAHHAALQSLTALTGGFALPKVSKP
ncbi:outer membrane protein TolC [Roseimicrobium gellanilyticum]|uniref:Outer membrane protein TolC n=1 Tax=Roseimicrobium gellanilyticum TaxID=748857 RepID=A0A366H8P4_9BACT|nr:TolC family protein [Roseimicrobium gellanilyticum]RBP38609.1 outer membrane protein TolC [Roseimicrobium gellanilyticum]